MNAKGEGEVHSTIYSFTLNLPDSVHLVHQPVIGLLYQPRMLDEYGEFGGMRTGREYQSAPRKPGPVPLCPPQIPHDLTWDRTSEASD